MSALVGIFRLDDGCPVTAHDLQPLMDATAVYGGDGQAVWTDGAVGMGFHMRHFTPESVHEHMPLAQGHLTIVADARIDNRGDLFAALDIPHSERANMSDSQLILHAYHKWECDTAIHLIGDFAFVIWDSHARRLYCARDHIGVRPFYYYQTHDVFIFSSDLQALLTSPEVLVELDEELLVEMLAGRLLLSYHPHHTKYRNMKQLVFGHQMIVDRSGIVTRQYWTPPVGTTLQLSSDEEYFECAREVVQRAVHDRVRTDFGVGAQLSGGIDSSSVAVIAARCLRQQDRRLFAYSWAPPGPKNPSRRSEHYRIGAVAEQEDIIVRYLPPYYRSTYNIFVSGREQPWTTERHDHAQATIDGVRVLLSGWGGDEFISFNGRGYRADLFVRGRWWQLLKTLYWGRFPRGIYTNVHYLWRDVVLTLAPDWFYARFSEHDKLLRRQRAFGLLKPAFAAKVERAYATRRPFRYQQRSVKESQLYLFQTGHIARRIEEDSTRAMASNLIMAYPLLDRRVLEFVFQLPDNLFLRSGTGRYLFRKAMKPLLPLNMFDVRDIAVKLDMAMAAHQLAIQELISRRNRPPVELPCLDHDDNPWVDIPRTRESVAQTSAFMARYEDPDLRIALGLVALWNEIKELDRESPKMPPVSV